MIQPITGLTAHILQNNRESNIQHIVLFFERKNLFADEQYGFRRKKNINMAIFNLFDKIITSIDNRSPVAALFMDMSKAFDFVDRTILFKKLERYGVRGNALKLLESYLSDRRQVTRIHKVCFASKTERTYVSSQRPNNYGVPQGCILGSLLFIIYINDMPRETHHPMVLFADDSRVVFSGSNDATTLEREINHCLQVLVEWMD